MRHPKMAKNPQIRFYRKREPGNRQNGNRGTGKTGTGEQEKQEQGKRQKGNRGTGKKQCLSSAFWPSNFTGIVDMI